MIDAQELADELLERFSIATTDGCQSDETAIASLLQRYPINTDTQASWQSFLDGVSNPLNALPIERDAARELAALLASNAEKEGATPDRAALSQYIELGFTLYAQKEGVNGEGKSYRFFVDLQGRGRKYNNKPNAAIKTAAELDAALQAGFSLFGFLPSERGFLCIDVDCGHEGGANGFENVNRWLLAKGFAGRYNPLNEARAYVDTPSGGRHYYFTGKAKCLAKIPGLESVDVFGRGTGATLTAAGSVKKGRVYRLHGRLSDAAPVNAAFAGFFTNDEYTEQAREAEKPKRESRNTARRGNSYSIAEKVSYYAAKSPKAGRNNAAHYCALRLGWQSSFNELYAAMRADSHFAGLPDGELITAIQSGMKESRKL